MTADGRRRGRSTAEQQQEAGIQAGKALQVDGRVARVAARRVPAVTRRQPQSRVFAIELLCIVPANKRVCTNGVGPPASFGPQDVM